MSRKHPKALEPLVHQLQVLGFSEAGQRRHQKWIHQETGARFTTPVSPSDHRTLRNALAALRRLCRERGIGR